MLFGDSSDENDEDHPMPPLLFGDSSADESADDDNDVAAVEVFVASRLGS